MDPHQLQNFQNSMGLGAHGQQQPQQQMVNQQQAQYNPMLIQQQYMNNFGFYGNNQMVMDPFQQQNYLMQMQNQQMQPMFQQQQQHLLQQQQQQQQPVAQQQVQHQQYRFMQQQQQQPQHQPQATMYQQQQEQQQTVSEAERHQQRLLQEQQRLIEERRQNEMHEMREKQRQKEAAERAEQQRREQELMIQREKERQELLRQQEEAARQAEEQRRREEAERLEKEKLLRIREEQMRKKKENESVQKDMENRMDHIGHPLSLVSTHFLSDLRTLIPFPCENMATSRIPIVSDHDNLDATLANLDQNAVSLIAKCLAQVDVSDIRTRQDMVEQENNDLPLNIMPDIIKNVIELNSEAFDVEPEHDNEVDMFTIQDFVQDGPPRVLVQTEKVQAPPPAPVKPPPVVQDVNEPSTSAEPETEVPKVQIQLDSKEAAKLRKQMISMGKCPKGGNQRKKKDMVESLYDSLTDYFDPSDARDGRRRRVRQHTMDDEDDEEALKRDLELIAKMEAAEHKLGEEGTSGASDDETSKTPKKRRKREEERPPTPTEVIHQRELEWNERQRKRMEKQRRRRIDDDQDCWNNDLLAENDSFAKFSQLVEQVLDQVEDMDVLMAANGKAIEEDDGEDDEVNPELLIERVTVDELRKEAQKLKSWRKLNKVPVDRLVKLIYMLERNMRDVISQDGSRLLVPLFFDEDGEEDEAALKELVGDRLHRACDAASAALIIMTSYKMPKQVFIEDAIDRSINLCKHYLNNIVFPASDSVFRASKSGRKGKGDDGRRKKKAGTNNRTKMVEEIYTRIADLMTCFAQLVKVQSLSETSLHHLATLAISSFFVNNVGVLQQQAMILASNIFAIDSIRDDQIRISILTDILNSLHRLPPGKNTNNSYRLDHDHWISNTTVLVMQLIQSVVKMPKRKKHEEQGKNELNPDTVVKDSIIDAQRLTGVFLQGFLGKCSCKGNKSEGEEDYRRIFDGFLQDLLTALYKPEWPAAEMILTVLGALLVKHYRAKSTDMTIRQASLDYLGSITARLRKDTRSAHEDSDLRLEIVVKTLVFEEQEEVRWSTVNEVDISDISTTDRLKKLEQALIDYLIEKKGDDPSVEFAVVFYAGEWYKETAEDLDMAKQEFKAEKHKDLSDKDRRKLEKRLDRMYEKGAAMKEFLIKLVDRKHMRKRSETISRLGNVMMESDAAWAVKYLASRREFSHSFETYLRHILYGVTVEGTVGLRTRAMKCLTQIIEADHEVLGMADVRNAVNSRMMDPNAAVREATIELLGKFLLVKEEFIPTYYSILLERIKDSGTAVRKRVIRIMREICEKYPNFENIPDMLAKLVRRVVDEDGVKKLVQDTFAALWFQPCSDRHPETLIKKVIQMTAVAHQCATEQTIDFLEQLLQALLKQGDKALISASRQIVDSLVDNVLVLETKLASDTVVATSNMNGEDLSGAQLQKNNQDRLLACLTTLSIFSKVRPELMVKHAETLQPYLSMTAGTPAEQQVLNEVINMLERVVPLMNHPSDAFLSGLDESLANLATNSGMVIVGSAISCASAVWHKFPRKPTNMTQKFLVFLRNLNSVKMTFPSDLSKIPQARMPALQRAVYTIGLLARYFDFDAILEGDVEATKSLVVVNLTPNAEIADTLQSDEDSPESRRYRDNVFVLLEHFSHSTNQAIRQKALTSMGHICAQHAEYLARPEVKNMYMSVMMLTEPHYLPLKIQALKNLELFLLNEDRKAVKSNAEWEKSKDQQNLKEMELSGSGLSSAVIQVYWNSVLNCYFYPNEAVRQASVQVTCLTLNQGLVTPGSSIPTLIAMTTDPVNTIRNKVENLLKEIDTKYSGMVQSKAIAGIRIAFRLNSMIKPPNVPVVRGIRACDASAIVTTTRGRDASGLPRMTNDGQAILSGLYSSLRVNRSHRRSFLNNTLRLFSEDCREKLSLEEWIFVADNVAMFPYQVLDEPLYAIRLIDNIISMSGQTIVNQFKENLVIPHNQPLEEDDVLFEPEMLFNRFPDDKTALFTLMLNSQSCFILLYLKNFLVKLYGFTEAKVQEYSPSEAAKVYEKAVTRKNVQTFQPLSALEELRPEVIEERKSLQGVYKLAHKICSFRKMLLSLDRAEDDDGDEGGETSGVTEQEEDDVDGDLTDTGMSDHAVPMEE